MIDLSRVVMPLVGVMNDARLAWCQRERVAEAIQHCLIHYRDLQAEADKHDRPAEQASQQAPRRAPWFPDDLRVQEPEPDPPTSFDTFPATRPTIDTELLAQFVAPRVPRPEPMSPVPGPIRGALEGDGPPAMPEPWRRVDP